MSRHATSYASHMYVNVREWAATIVKLRKVAGYRDYKGDTDYA